MDRSTDACDTAMWAASTVCGTADAGTESDFERLCRERRRALDDMRKLEEDLRREQAQRRFQRIRYGYR
ncbi:MAG TPA: hypothetical protein VGV09_17945 [Steroidobacteraceae bacterium]|nr:hypothetical protein [Steroidobacteraceae bacterium]